MGKSRQIITISQSEHKLKGINKVEYHFDFFERKLLIYVDDVKIGQFEGKDAVEIYNAMGG